MRAEISWLMASKVELRGHRMNVWICRHRKLFGVLYNYLTLRLLMSYIYIYIYIYIWSAYS